MLRIASGHERYAATSARCRRRPPGRASCAARRSPARGCGRRARPCAGRAARRAARRSPRSRIARERVEDDVDDRRRKPQRRLVEQQHVGLGDERARDRELLLLAAGEHPGVSPPELVHDREELVDARAHRGRDAVARGGRRARGAGSPRPSARRRCGGPRARARCPLRATSSGRRPRSDASPSRIVARRDRRRAHDRVQRRRLAAPFGPISPTISPGSTSSDRPRTACTAP